MNRPQKPESLVGRFVVDLGGTRRIGLAAHEVLALLEKSKGESPAIYRIHRVDEDGRMELVGTPERQFAMPDCLILGRHRLDETRADFETLRSAAAENPPPCRIDLQFAEAASRVPPYLVALIFPAACSEAVGHWLRRVDLESGQRADGGRAALQAYQEAQPRVIEHAVLKIAAPRGES